MVSPPTGHGSYLTSECALFDVHGKGLQNIRNVDLKRIFCSLSADLVGANFHEPKSGHSIAGGSRHRRGRVHCGEKS